jgi:tRNA A-37 threonylcarbamoyl transferase component Bud32/Tfp pilus assembly protein PilZ
MDKRNTTRFVPRRIVTALLESQDLVPLSLARVADISEGGVCLWTNAALHTGDVLILQLSFPEEDQPFQAAGRVVWSESGAAGRCGVAWAATAGPQQCAARRAHPRIAADRPLTGPPSPLLSSSFRSLHYRTQAGGVRRSAFPGSGRKRRLTCPSCGAAHEADLDVCFSCGRLISALTQGAILAARYEIQTQLGKGGMGVVYKAHDRLLDETVAIKVLRSELMNTPELARRFRSEIKLARKVTHTNVCRIHEYGEDGPLSYISMALIEGTDLRKLLRQQPEGLPVEEAFEAAIQSADGLQAIHSVGIIHRDLKTPNIVRDDLGIVRLMDFGIAKEANHNAGLTATGEVMGTPEYMSPEQCRGRPARLQERPLLAWRRGPTRSSPAACRSTARP